MKVTIIPILLLLINFNVNANTPTLIDLTNKIDQIAYLHVPKSDVYQGQYFVIYDATDRANKYGHVAMIDKNTFAVTKILKIYQHRRVIEEIHSDDKGVLYVKDSKGNIYRSKNKGGNWLQLDLNRQTKLFEFKGIKETHDKYRTGYSSYNSDIRVNSSGDVLLYNSYSGDRISVIKAGENTAPLGPLLNTIIDKEIRNIRDNIYMGDCRKVIINDEKGTYQSSDFGTTFLNIPSENYTWGATDDCKILSKKGYSTYFVGQNKLSDSRSDLNITRNGLMHTNISKYDSSSNLHIGHTSNLALTKTEIEVKNYKQIKSLDTLVITKRK
ncbi:hypothetical protein CXF85_10185 [Colwellia sp. 75C3]|uniref:hypothetical protein n=1 Tax=Colwellia sp. 75C3 TaxID=888425 RepID=UPI000C32E39F|nr:hypothetical protein [Colwellia sp. 75C3]PKG83857.1 hypothetical protein CXF85_10185 [Colwellia sp. 75C3]